MSTHRRYDAFICYYRRTGATLAQLFRANLEARGLKIFLDVKADYWGPFPSELKERVADTPYFIVLLTTGCFDSPWMKVEIAEALKTQRKILVVRDASFMMPRTETLDPVLQALSMLNQITYVHDFSDEVVRRVAMLISDAAPIRLQRSNWLRATLFLALCAAAGVSIAFAWAARAPHPKATEAAAKPQPVAPVETIRQTLIEQPTPTPEPPNTTTVHTRIQQELPGASSTRSTPLKAAVKPLDPKTVAPSTPTSADPCVMNYWFDQHGDKHYKPECYLKPSGGR